MFQLQNVSKSPRGVTLLDGTVLTVPAGGTSAPTHLDEGTLKVIRDRDLFNVIEVENEDVLARRKAERDAQNAIEEARKKAEFETAVALEVEKRTEEFKANIQTQVTALVNERVAVVRAEIEAEYAKKLAPLAAPEVPAKPPVAPKK